MRFPSTTSISSSVVASCRSVTSALLILYSPSITFTVSMSSSDCDTWQRYSQTTQLLVNKIFGFCLTSLFSRDYSRLGWVFHKSRGTSESCWCELFIQVSCPSCHPTNSVTALTELKREEKLKLQHKTVGHEKSWGTDPETIKAECFLLKWRFTQTAILLHRNSSLDTFVLTSVHILAVVYHSWLHCCQVKFLK